MKVRDVLAFYAALKGFYDSGPSINEWLERLGLGAWGAAKVSSLSKGMAQRVQFIAAIIARPQLVLLDEPFSGLDPVNAEVLRNAVLDLRHDGTTVIFSTHDMSVAEKMCDLIFMIHKGNKVLDGSLESIQEAYGHDTIRVRLEGGSLDRLPGVVKITDYGKLQELRLEPGTDPEQILALLTQRGKVRHFEIAHPSLADIFVRIAGASVEEAVHA
jgi:ABC-2 type transport system ATP-binding protein